ncbi:MAG: hypothetical protein HY865_13395 [Chloroflexi bacterium]|nr:hypothetical protein [Chloroflexota bacterium]
MATKSEDQVKAETTETQLTIPIVDKVWIIVLMLYLVALGIISVWALIAFFPCETAAEAASTCSKVVGFMFWNFSVSSEVRMILLVLMAGALGSLIHGFRSLFWYVGNRAFVRSWILMYFLLPFIGSSLSLIFYFVIRGGLFSPNATVDATSPFGFIGLAGLVGMFSNRAALKLQEIAESIFSTKESTKGKDNVDNEEIASANKADKATAAAEVKADKDTAAAEVQADKDTAAAEVKANKEIAAAEVQADKEAGEAKG